MITTTINKITLFFFFSWYLKAKQKGLVKDIPHGDTILFSISCAFILCCYEHDSPTVRSSFVSFFDWLFGREDREPRNRTVQKTKTITTTKTDQK